MTNDSDRHWFEQHLGGFVPPKVFDVHAHLYRRVDATDSVPAELYDAEGVVGWNVYQRALDAWAGQSRPTAGLFFTFPKPDLDIEPAKIGG